MPAQANRNLFAYRLKEKDGTVITTPDGQYNEFLHTGESLGQATNMIGSETIRSDGQIAQNSRVGAASAGDVSFEVAYGNLWDFLLAGLRSIDWTATITAISADTTIECVDATNEYRTTVTGGFVDFINGTVIEVLGFTTAGNNGFARVVTLGDFNYGGAEVNNSLIVEWVDLVDEVAGDSIGIRGSEFITNGTREILVDAERQYLDLTPDFATFDDLAIDGLTLDLAPGAMITGAASFVGRSEASSLSTRVGTPGGVLVSSPAFKYVNAANHVPQIVAGSGAFDGNCVASALNFAIANNYRPQEVICDTPIPQSHTSGTFNLTGGLSVFYEDSTLVDRHLNFADDEIRAVITDADGNNIVIEVPAINYESSPRVPEGINTDIIAVLSWAAKMHGTKGYMMRVHRIPA